MCGGQDVEFDDRRTIDNKELWRRNQRALFESKSKNFVAIPKGVSFQGKLIIETTKMGVIERDTEQIRILYNTNGFQDSK